ncbi:DUF3000 domain-containing protein [Citricoccus sp. K5]|uniref:DUF3000 domain-containing protein n=1 Tax=Citricoccus sp. K5 TaxID=2653135 RepID=UPI0012F25985|nr:DUF3000 domain-containing protein [Citricoccus sp. K5]VXB43076.1 conserved hypothetical protein [Citricoccus sp. K5]
MRRLPGEFREALSGLRRARHRQEITLDEIPAPGRLAPFAVALAAEVHDPAAEGRPELATGRFVLLHDPAGSPVWKGTFRVVTYIRASLESDLGNDPMVGAVAWTWLVEALETHRARYTEAGGTATRVLSESFGGLATRPDTIDIELRASWTPEGPDSTDHLEAWADMVCAFAGLPPVPDGVTPLPRIRRN